VKSNRYSPPPYDEVLTGAGAGRAGREVPPDSVPPPPPDDQVDADARPPPPDSLPPLVRDDQPFDPVFFASGLFASAFFSLPFAVEVDCVGALGRAPLTRAMETFRRRSRRLHQFDDTAST